MWCLFLFLFTQSHAFTYEILQNRAFRTIPENFASFTLDFHPDAPAWGKNASILELDLKNPLFRALTKNLAPAILRIGGSNADDMVFAFQPGSSCDGLYYCLTPERWMEILDFANATGVQVLYDLNIMSGRNGNGRGPWNYSSTEDLFSYTAKNTDYIPWFELGNERQNTFSGTQTATDFKVLRQLVNKHWPGDARPVIYGPSCHIIPDWIDEFCTQGGCDAVDVFGFHLYTGYGKAEHIAQQIPTTNFLHDMSVLVQAVRDLIPPSKPIAITETASCWASGHPGTSNAFMDGYLYLTELNFAATRENFNSVMRQTLTGGYYSLIDNAAYVPNPNYYVTAVWKKLVGTKVLQTFREPVIGHDIDGDLFVYAYCGKAAGQVILSFANLGSAVSLNLGVTGVPGVSNMHKEEYFFTSDAETSRVVNLNGRQMNVSSEGALPDLSGKQNDAGLTLPQESFGFVTLFINIKACS